MRLVQRVFVPGLAGQVTVLAVLDATVGLRAPGWTVGLACGLVVTALLTLGLVQRTSAGLGPADRVTLARATLVGGVAGLAAGSVSAGTAGEDRQVLVALATVALLLDWVDGQVARRTGTVSELGARFDMEVDALLILALSVYVATAVGSWVLLIGAARYLRLLACLPWPWLRMAPPVRHWAKVVAAIQGVVLTATAGGIMPARFATPLLVGALGLLAESFGREVWWLSTHRPLDVVEPYSAEQLRGPAGAAGVAA